MADILIHMEMPKYTTKAEFGIDADGNPLCMVYHEDGTEPDIYDVVPLPEGHGRLGDLEIAEAILHNKAFDLAGTSGEYNALRWALRQIKALPTIVPSEGGSDDEHV